MGSPLHYIISEAYSGRRKGSPTVTTNRWCIECEPTGAESFDTRHPIYTYRQERGPALWSVRYSQEVHSSCSENHSLCDCVPTVWCKQSTVYRRQSQVVGSGSAGYQGIGFGFGGFLPGPVARMDLSVVCGRFVNKVEELYRIDNNHVLGR